MGEILGSVDAQVSILANGDTREMIMEMDKLQFNGDIDCIVEASSMEEKILAGSNVN